MLRPIRPLRLLTSVASYLVVAGTLLSMPMPLAASSASIPPASPPVVKREAGPEAMLLQIYRDLGRNRLHESLEKANKLVEAYPTFKLGHLLRGDLLTMHAMPVTRFGATANAPDEQLKDLVSEASARIRSLQERPDPQLLPRAVMQLSSELKNVFVVDVTRSRLYIYENRDGNLQLKTDYYVTQGKLGGYKVKEGDKRTPIGVYYVNGYIPGAKLPDFYGPGALPINYPNEWDRQQKRDGYGIWLHGVPSDTYSRPPLASDGCVVLSNDDFNRIVAEAEVGRTAVLISENIEFISRDTWHRENQALRKLPAQWQATLTSGEQAAIASLYSDEFRSHRGDDKATWLSGQYRSSQARRIGEATISDLSLFHYPGNGEMIVGTMTLDTGARKNSLVKKRLYWKKEGKDWKIIYEGPAA